MNCPKCGGTTSIDESRIIRDGKRRRRTCSQCKYKFATMEVLTDEVKRYDNVIRKLTNTVHMLEFVRDNCGIAITQLKKMETELDD